jgi:gluconokinase
VSAANDPIALVVMGVAGCGKSTIGEAVARQMHCRFVEGDTFHPPQNIAKMTAGYALDDEDRWPWLDSLGRRLAEPGLKVASCSALKLSYRVHLANAANPATLYFAHLDVTADELLRRADARSNHFWPSRLLPSQLAILDRPKPTEANAQCFDGKRPVTLIVGEIITWFDERREKI